jgi:hypothetical protein
VGIDDEVSEFLVELYMTTCLTFPGMIYTTDVFLFRESQVETLKQEGTYFHDCQLNFEAEDQMYRLKCGGYVKSYEAMCSYYGIEPRFEICWDIDNLYHFNDITEFRLSDFKNCSYLNKSIFTYSKTLIPRSKSNVRSITVQSLVQIPRRRLSPRKGNSSNDFLYFRHQLFSRVSSTQGNRFLILISNAQGCGLSKDLCSSLRRSFESNPKIKVTAIDISDNTIEDNGLLEILKYLDTCKVKVTHLDVSGCNISERGMFHFANKLHGNALPLNKVDKSSSE